MVRIDALSRYTAEIRESTYYHAKRFHILERKECIDCVKSFAIRINLINLPDDEAAL